MERHVKLALLALALPPSEGDEPVVVAVGSRSPAGDVAEEWLAAILPAAEVKTLLKDDLKESADKLEQLLALQWSRFAGRWFNEGLVGISDGTKAYTDTRRHDDGKSLWIDGIERVHFFSAGLAGKENLDEVLAPLVALDCAGTAVYGDTSETGPSEPSPRWARSRLKLTLAQELWPAPADPDAWKQRNTPVSITSFALVAHVPMPAGAHGGNGVTGKRFDPRVLLFASADRAKQPSLWFTTAQGGVSVDRLSARFHSLRLALTDKVDLTSSKDATHLHAMASMTKAWLTSSAPVGGGIPLLACLDIYREDAPNIRVWARRAGFRPSGKQLYLRCELGCRATSWTKLWQATYGDIAQDPRPVPAMLDVDDEELCWIGFEQQSAGHVLQFAQSEASDWSVLLRFDAHSKAASGLVEHILLLFKDFAGKPNDMSLRRFRPETSMRILLDLKAKGNSTNLPWQAVGSYTAPRARRVLWHAPSWPKLAAARMAARMGDLRLQSFQPASSTHWWTEKKWEASVSVDQMRARTIANELVRFDSNNARVRHPFFGAKVEPGDGLQPQYPSRLAPGQTGIFFDVAGMKLGDQPRIAIGSLELGLGPDSDVIDYEVARIVHDRPADSLAEIRNEVAMHLPATAVSPIAQDPLPAFARDTGVAESTRESEPLLLPLGAADPLKLKLVATESFGEWIDQKVEWELSVVDRSDAARQPATLIVIDPRPLRIAAVNSVKIEADDATSDLIASFKAGDDGHSSWRFLNKAQKSRLLLPPQIIGEAMEKRIKHPDLEDDIAEGETVEARFGSLTRVDLDATYRDTDTQEPGWNLRRILNRVADAAPGALLRELRVELAYGLIARHSPRTETWIAEIGGIVGLPPPLPKGGTSGGKASALALRRSALLRLQASRIAIDKVWKGRPEARFETSDDLTFTLRLHEPHGTDANGPETAFRYPVAQPMVESWPALADATRPDQSGPVESGDPLIATFTDDKSGFPGGVPWAFESANILDEVYRTPVSREGRLGDLYLSTLGGWGQQRAAFASGKSIIETETTQGRMGYYKLERLGRIGALHNRAKHVIIYRRSVAPAAQFYNTYLKEKKQDPHAGRPILRKVEEYVEILETERAYPENGTALVEAGCLVGSRFVTKKMLVQSDWGRDVRREGWMVPLWRNDLAAPKPTDPKPTDPKPLNEDSPAALFPKPLVQLMMLGEDGKPVAVEIDSPEKLVFYTSSIKSETAELIDQWHAVEGIDFCDAPPPLARETSSPTSRDLHDAMLGPAPRNAGGHDPLTLALVDAKVPIQIAARRVEDGPAIVPKNISLSRARPTAGDGSSLSNNARSVGVASAQLEADLRGRLDRLFGRIPAAFAGLARETASGKNAALEAIKRSEAELLDELSKIAEAAGDAIKALEKSIPSEGEIAKGAERTVHDVFGRIESERGRINARVATALEQGRLLFANEVTRRAAKLKAQLKKVAGTLEVVAVGDPVKGPKDDLVAARAALEKSLGELTAETKQEINEAFRHIHVNREALKRACDLTGPIADLKIRTCDSFAVLDAQLKTIGDEAKAWRFNTEEAVKSTQAQAKARFGELRQGQRAARQQLEKLALAARIPEALKDAATAAIGLIDRTGAALNTIEQEVDAAVAVADDAALKLKLETEVAALAQNVATARDTVLAVIDASASGAEDLKAFLKARVEALNGTTAVWETKCGEVLDEAYKASLDALKIVEGEAKALLAAVDGSFVTQEIKDAAGRAAAKIRAELLPALDTLAAQPERALDKLDDALKDASEAWQAIVAQARQETLALLAKFTPALDAADAFSARIKAQIEGVADTGQATVGAIEQQIHRFADEARRAVEAVGDEIDALRTRLEDMAAREARRIGDRLGAALGEAQSELARMVGKPPSDLLKDGTTLYQEGDNLMRAIRMVGEGPSANGLGLNRPEVAYVLDALKPLVDMTPAVALANRVASQAAAAEQAAQAAVKLMEALGLRLPVSAIGKDLVPDVLTGLSVSRMCPKFAGLSLDGLLTRAGFPDLSGKDSQGVKVTRGFDKERREAWLKAEIDVKLDKPASLLEFGPVAIMLDQGQFRAQTRISIDASGHVEKEAKGMLAGDWRVVTSGMDVVTFEKTPLVFDKTGKLDFQIANDRVRLAPTLEFLTTLMSKLKQSVPTGIEVVMRGGVPAGLMAKIAIDIPPVATGVFAITDLNVAASFGIVAYPTFEILAGLDVGSRDAPFTLSVWILNGGGYINQRLSYQPMTRPRPILDYTLDVAIVAGVGLGFGFGVVSGAVWLQVGCSVAMKWTTGPGGNVTTVTAFLLARGNVDVAGLVTAGIMLRLEISYDGAEMRARGTLRLSFRISCFYTLRVAQGVEYKLLGEKRSKAPADDYADSFQ